VAACPPKAASSPEELGRFVAAEVNRRAAVVRDNKIKAGQ